MLATKYSDGDPCDHFSSVLFLSKMYGYKINALIEALKNSQGEALI